jgi:hypothetical protein
VPQQPTKRLRSSLDVFDWHIHCLFCGKLVAVGQDNHSATTLQIKTTVEKKCLERDDEWGREFDVELVRARNSRLLSNLSRPVST